MVHFYSALMAQDVSALDILRTHEWLKPRHMLADRGYDSRKNHAVCMERGIIPIIHIRKRLVHWL